jgi:cytochrome c biogenesis protein CcmG/thiol:disulfide interchange protein DsbE
MSRGVGREPLGVTDAGFVVASDFTLPTLDGGLFTLAEHADGPVFLYFWASWCRTCQRDAPVVQRVWPDYEQAGYTFVGVNILDDEEDARAFIERYRLSFPNVRDLSGRVYLEYGVYGIPESFFLRPGLLVSEKFLGEFSESALRRMLDDAR